MISQEKAVTYVARDIERALGMNPGKAYRIVTNSSPFSETIKKQFPESVQLIKNEKILDTADLLKEAIAKKMIAGQDIVVFKNTNLIQDISKQNGLNLLNPDPSFAEEIENKLTQVEWLGEMAKEYLPNPEIIQTRELTWNKKSFVVQWAHGHTGEGTMLIQSQKDLNEIQERYPERPARKMDLINGPSFTVNVVVSSDKILMGNVSFQITGLEPFTDNRFSTVGNDWSLTHTLLSETEIGFVETMIEKIGIKLREGGWKGLFGIDFMKDEERNKISLIEINARQPASTTFESFLQEKNRLEGIGGLTIFEAHIKALKGEKAEEQLIPINDGAQIVQRNTSGFKTVSKQKTASLEKAGYWTVSYENTGPNSDLLRVQSPKGIMSSPTKLNSRGNEIKDLIHS